MPTWIIVLSSAIGAIVLATALAVAEVMNAPRSDIGTILMPHLPVLAVGALGVYGLGAMLLTTTNLVASMIWMRHHLGRAALGRTPAWRDWIAALGTDGFRRLATRSAQAGPESADNSVVLSAPFTADEARSEIARRNYICLARSHFLSVLIVLVGIVGLGVAQNHGALPFQTGVIPTVSADFDRGRSGPPRCARQDCHRCHSGAVARNYCPANRRARRDRPSAPCRVVARGGSRPSGGGRQNRRIACSIS